MDLPFARSLQWTLPQASAGRALGQVGEVLVPDTRAGGEEILVDHKIMSSGSSSALTVWVRYPAAIRRFGRIFLLGRLLSSAVGIGLLWYYSSSRGGATADAAGIAVVVVALGLIVGLRRLWSREVEPRLQREDRARMNDFCAQVIERVEATFARAGASFERRPE